MIKIFNVILTHRKYVWIISILLPLIWLGGCTPPAIPPISPPPAGGQPATAPKITFSVKVPAATPPEDIIYVCLGSGQQIRMNPVGALTWEVEYTPPPGVPITYGYNRNGVGYEASEEITDRDTDADWNRKRNFNVSISQQVTQKDEVKKWRWLLNEPVAANILPDTIPFQPRIGGRTFQKGMAVIDYWWQIFRTNGETEDTVERVVRDNASCIQYSPTWVLDVSEEGIKLSTNSGYAYPEDAIRYEIRTARNAGLKIILRNQVWMELAEEQITKSRPAAWWESYYETRHQYLVNMAKIAAEEGVEAMSIGSDSDTLCAFAARGNPPPDAMERYVQSIREVRRIYPGMIYYDFTPAGLLQNTFEIDWEKWQPVLDEVDFVGVSSWKGISSREDPTVEELVKNAGDQFDLNYRPLYERTGKPVVFIGLAYASAQGGSTGKYAYNAREIDTWKPDDGTPNDFQEQADVYEAIMRAVALRPWITGVYSFGFWRHEQQDKFFNIRGKPAEEVLRKWYGAIK